MVHSPSAGSRKLRAYLQLMRLPALFTAMADVLMGFVVTHGNFEPLALLALLLGSSSLIYLAGMILNDVYDIEIDTVERPSRPLPSRRIDTAWAKQLGFGMLLAGVALAGVASAWIADVRPVTVAAVLAILVVGYDKLLKHTPLGPLAMGGCRVLNVLLGMSAAVGPWATYHYWIAAGVGLYIAGVTWFARGEAERSSRSRLVFGLAVMSIAIVMLAFYPQYVPIDRLSELPLVRLGNWNTLWTLLGLLIVWRGLKAIIDPSPQAVQFTVKQSLLSLIMLDAVICTGIAQTIAISPVAPDMGASLVILLLLLPAMLLGRWIYST